MPTTTVDIDTPDGVADAYLSTPNSSGPGEGDRRAGVLFVMDAIGLRPRIAEMTERIAERGYVVLAPNFFYRDGRSPVFELPDMKDPDNRGKLMPLVRPMMEKLTPEALASDGGAFLDYLDTVAAAPFAITGYCMGARVAWRIAVAHPDRVAAIAGFHGGGLVTEAPDSPHLSAGDLKAEVYFGHADQDQSMTPENVATLERAMDEAGVGHRTEVYEGALHGYTMSDTAVYDEKATERHFEELFTLLGRTLA